MLTEKLCYTQLSSNQSESQAMFFTCVRNGTSNQKPQRCMPLAVVMDSTVECT